MPTPKLLVGAHISIAGGYYKAVDRAQSIDCTTMQIFTKSNKSWFGKPISEEEASTFKKALKSSGLEKIMVHSAYLINLASSNPEVRKKSIASLTQEMHRCEQLGIHYLILHPGSHTGCGEEAGIAHIARGLDAVLEKCTGSTMILLETSAGQGTSLGHTLQQLKSMRDLTKLKKNVGICVDTCHIWAAGYDIGTPEGYKAFWDNYDKTLGSRSLKAMHLNDSKTPLGSRRDRHAQLGKGSIPLKAFEWIMQDVKLSHLPKVLETPPLPGEASPDYYAPEIKLLKKFASKKKE